MSASKPRLRRGTRWPGRAQRKQPGRTRAGVRVVLRKASRWCTSLIYVYTSCISESGSGLFGLNSELH